MSSKKMYKMNISQDEYILPDEVSEAVARDAAENLIPSKSKSNYGKTYEKLVAWKKSQGISSSNEKILLDYFKELSKQYKPITLLTIASMLKSMLIVKEDVDITNYHLLNNFLRKEFDVLISFEQVQQFLNEAPDHIYLATKVALIFAIHGVCQGCEFANVRVQDVTKFGKLIIINIYDNNAKEPRKFVIDEEYFETIEKYMSVRPTTALSHKFFLNYQKGKCTVQPIGKHKFQGMPRTIVQYLNLKDTDCQRKRIFWRNFESISVKNLQNQKMTS